VPRDEFNSGIGTVDGRIRESSRGQELRPEMPRWRRPWNPALQETRVELALSRGGANVAPGEMALRYTVVIIIITIVVAISDADHASGDHVRGVTDDIAL
jgi:hypothetical protein